MKLAIVRASGMEARVEWGKKSKLEGNDYGLYGESFLGKGFRIRFDKERD